MSLVKTTRRIAKIGTLLSLVTTLFLVSDAKAQEQICECVDTYAVVPVRTVSARRAARPSKIKRSYRPAAPRTVVKRNYRTVYGSSSGRYVYYTTGNGHKVYTNERYTPRAVDADYYDTRRIASDYGLKDGFYDGYQAGMERDAYHPENSGDYRKATNGYEDDFGDKNVYRQAYRRAYLKGYNSGWRSVAQRSTYRAVRY